MRCVRAGVAVDEAEHVHGRVEELAEDRRAEDSRAVEVVVDDPPDAQRRQREEHRQQTDGDGQAAAGQRGADTGGEPAAEAGRLGL